jgi:hypothetical protein
MLYESMEKKRIQILWKVYDLKREVYPATDNTDHSELITFMWKYRNSYDRDRGKAEVVIDRTFTKDGVKFIAEIMPLGKHEFYSA